VVIVAAVGQTILTVNGRPITAKMAIGSALAETVGSG
jgi:hypothetical protein